MEEKNIKAKEETEVKKPAAKRRGRPKKEESVEEVKAETVSPKVETKPIAETSQKAEAKYEAVKLKEKPSKVDNKAEAKSVKDTDKLNPVDELANWIELTELTPIFKTQLIDEPEMGVVGLTRVLDECVGCDRKYVEIMNPGFGLIRGYISK